MFLVRGLSNEGETGIGSGGCGSIVPAEPPFNGVLANQAACDVLQMVLGYAPSRAFVVYKMYDGFSGTITDWEVSSWEDCPHCSAVVANGDQVWA